MQIPRFWANASDQAKANNGQDLQLKCWGWSNESLEDARIKAAEVLERLVTRVRQGLWRVDRYPYGVRAMREEIIQEVPLGSSQPAIITRNSYGALIMNTERAMFIDIDVPEPKKGFFGKAKQTDQPLDKLRKQLGELRASFRIYRTAGGFRVLATDSLFEPDHPSPKASCNPWAPIQPLCSYAALSAVFGAADPETVALQFANASQLFSTRRHGIRTILPPMAFHL